jgi:hypothetical protein
MILSPILTSNFGTQIGHMLTQIDEMRKSVAAAEDQLQRTIAAEKRALNNLKGVTDIKSWDDFMKWTNRQLYLERQAEDRFNNMGVKLGTKTYTMATIEDIPKASLNYVTDLFKDDFSDAEKKEIWTKMGLAPSNYTYLQVWNTREKNLAKSLLTKKDTINEDNQKWYERMNDIKNILVDDATKPEDEKLQEKGLLQYLLEVMMDTNKVTREMSYDNAVMNEYKLSQDKQAETPPTPPQLSDGWNRTDDFGPITDD